MTDLLQFSLFSESEALALDRAADAPPYPDDPSAIIVSVSGGVDSDACAVWARKRWPDRKIILWHAYLASMDWQVTTAHLRRVAEVIGNAEFVVVQAVYELTGEDTKTGYRGVRMRRLHDVLAHGPADDSDPDAILTLVDFWERARLGMPPTTGMRYCTKYFKSGLFDQWVTKRRGQLGSRAVLLSGERWQESDHRANVTSWEWRTSVALKPSRDGNFGGWDLLWARPVVDWRLRRVARLVVDAGIELHPGYAIQGQSTEMMLAWEGSEHGRARLSCIGCIYTNPDHLRVALATDGPDGEVAAAIDRLQGVERKVGRTWQQGGELLRQKVGRLVAR